MHCDITEKTSRKFYIFDTKCFLVRCVHVLSSRYQTKWHIFAANKLLAFVVKYLHGIRRFNFINGYCCEIYILLNVHKYKSFRIQYGIENRKNHGFYILNLQK